MKKVGIITFHRAINYGAMLQAVALQRAIEKMGFFSELIDYVDHLYDHYRISYRSSNAVKSMLKYLLYSKVRLRNKRFEDFLKSNSKLSARKYDRQNIHSIDESIYGVFITGSDQVFNPRIIDYDANYLLDFVNDKCKCNSYAASIGLEKLSEEDAIWLKGHLVDFNKLLIREKNGQDLLCSLGLNHSELVVDPTLLLHVDEWEKMEHVVKVPKHYILSYGFHKNEHMEFGVVEQSRRTGMPVCEISDRIRPNNNRIKMRGIGPAEWLYLIHHADYIFTNSFHGMIFSFIFNKQVWVSDSNDGTFSRMEDFLVSLGCEDRILNSNKMNNKEIPINYVAVNKLMIKKVLDSKKILFDILGSNESFEKK